MLKVELEEEIVTMLVSYGEGTKKKQKKKICSGERDYLTVATPIAGEDLGS